MAMIEINHHPSRRDLIVFASALPVVFGIVGALRWHAGSYDAARIIFVAGSALTLLVVAIPPARRWLYVGWMYAAFPLAWTISHVLLAAAYFLVAAPIGLALRAFGRDPMRRTLDRSAQSYWVTRETRRDDSRYFRQF